LPSGVGQHDPRRVLALADVDAARAEREEPLDDDPLRLSRRGRDVEVDAVLRRLRCRLTAATEDHVDIVRFAGDLDLVGLLEHDPPPERIGAEARESSRLGCVEEDVGELRAHRSGAP